MIRVRNLVLAARSFVAALLIWGLVVWFESKGFSLNKGGSLFALGFLLLAGTSFGYLASFFGLPKLTGYLLAGLVSGPSGLGIFGEQEVHNLGLVNGLALGLIGLQAGSEFTMAMLKQNLRSLFAATVSHVVIIGLGVGLLFYVTANQMQLLDVTTSALWALAAVWAGLAVSKSPAAVVAVLGETRAKGPLSDHALGIVVLLDVVVIVLFSCTLVVAKGALEPGSAISFTELQHLGSELMASIAAGTTFGLLIILYYGLIGRETLLFIGALAYGITAFCRFFKLETMLVFVVAGFVVSNLSRRGTAMVHTIESGSSTVMMVFFATAGASLHLHDLKQALPVVLVMAVGRMVLTVIAARIGHYYGKDGAVVTKYGFTPFISQAGLTIGLAVIMSEKLPIVGSKLATLAISVVTINEILGPVIFKWGLQKAGEAGENDQGSKGTAH